jgi:tetratricopeptide (TPR) repeat protein/CHAT domain-containing protein
MLRVKLRRIPSEPSWSAVPQKANRLRIVAALQPGATNRPPSKKRADFPGHERTLTSLAVVTLVSDTGPFHFRLRWARNMARFFLRAALIVFAAFFIGFAAWYALGSNEFESLSARVVERYRAGKYAEAMEPAQRALALAERGSGDAKVGVALNNLALLYGAQGRFAEAEPLYKRALALREKAFGPDHPEVGQALNNLAELYRAQGRFAEAEPLYKRALAIDEKALGPNHPDVGTDLNNVALLYDAQGRFADAEPLFKRALAIREKALGPYHPDVGQALNNLAEAYRVHGRYAEAEPLYQRALAIDEKALGPDHPDVGIDLNNLAALYKDQGRYAEAEPLYQRALAMMVKTLGPDHPNVGQVINNLALLYRTQGRYDEAELLYQHALAITEKALGPDHPAVGGRLNNLARLKQVEGRYAEAEPLYQRALAIREKALGPDHPEVGQALNNLALLYQDQGRYAEAEPLYQRALAIDEKALGLDHPTVGTDVNNLATLYQEQNRYAEAEPLYQRALAIAEKALGPDHPIVAADLNNLAALYKDQGRFAEAESLYHRALAIDEKALGPDHPDVGTGLSNLALLYNSQGRYAEAEPLVRRALAIAEKALGPDHPDVGAHLNNLATLYYAQSDWARAADYWRRSTSVIVRRAQRGTLASEAQTGKRKSEAAQNSWKFWDLVKAVYRMTPRQHDDAGPLREMFQTAQWAQSSEAAQSLAQMAARGAKGDPKLAALVRERQDLVAEWQRRDQARSAAVAQPPDKRNRDAEAANIERLTAIDARIAGIDQELAATFPDYAALANPSPLSVEDAQKQLGADEALVLFLDTAELKPTPEETFIWVVTKTDARWVRSELGTTALSREVTALRCGLDYDGAWLPKASRCPSLLGVTYSSADHDRGELLPFDLSRAHALYQGLFGQIEDLIKDKRLLIVPSGPLTQLPFGVLVTEPANTPRATSVAQYRDVAWFARKHAISVLPAVSSLKALRELAKESHAGESYIGFGDPLLDGDPARFSEDATAAKLAREARCPQPAQQVPSLSSRGAIRAGVRSNGGLTDIADLRTWVPLPETVDELCEVAQSLGVDPATHLYFGAKATETEIKRLSDAGTLAEYKIVHFATHGAIAGELSGAAEPGLILTPPEKASQTDDGYLSASEIAGLKLDADWIILSACNTAAGEANGAEALSGLARAFFYAGARSLLVSHWAINSESTVKLITKAVAELSADSKIGRAEALRRSMLSMIDNGNGYEAHPAFWAPFVLVGEGGAAR